MIPHRFARFLGAVLLLAPSLAFGQSTLQQPCTSAANGCTVQPVPAALNALYGNDLFLQNLIAARFNTLGAAALLNVGTATGTVADGGALTAEIARAKAAEQANTTAIQTNATAISAETSRAQGVELLKAPIASPAFTGVPTAPTAANGTNTNQIATTAFVLNNAGSGGGGGGTGGVPPTRLLTAAGLVQGGGDLTTDRTFTVPAATQSDVATGTDQTKALTSYSIAAALGAKAPLASPAFVGTPTAPTPSAADNSTKLATTAYVDRVTTGSSAFQYSAAQQTDFSANGIFVIAASGNFTASGSKADIWGAAYFNHQNSTGTNFRYYVDIYDNTANNVAAAGPVLIGYANSATVPVIGITSKLTTAVLIPGRSYAARLWVQRDQAVGPTSISSPTIGGVTF